MGFLERAQKGTGAEISKPRCICGRVEHCGPGVGSVVILGADAAEGGGGGITKGLLCQVKESELYPAGYWKKAEGFEEGVL